ncbi:MAG: sodium:proton antiporter [Lachnospiraceae bacterium]|nr:sodium:proton antiporter [Lachnospiraceae bacterium]
MLPVELDLNGLVGLGMSFRIDGFRIVYASVTLIMWLCSTMLSPEYFGASKGKARYYIFSFLTMFATLGVFMSGDLYTTFVFFEIMSFTSYILVVHTKKEEAVRAGSTYLAVAVIGGLVMLMGLFMLYNLTGTLRITQLKEHCDRILESGSPREVGTLAACAVTILFGFAAKAGMFPLHVWLPKAHPVAPAPASALLSGVLTKCGIFGILILVMEIMAGSERFGIVLYIFGFITMFAGALPALFSTDLKKTLACSSVSQIGFIIVGASLTLLLGEECTLAATGTLLYMVNHSMFKLCLFLSAGIIYMKTHSLDLNKLRGFGRDKVFLKTIFLIGALGISGVPLFSGYISKTLIHEGLVEYIHLTSSGKVILSISEWLFLLCGGMTAAYMTKLFIAIFVEKPAEKAHSSESGIDSHGHNDMKIRFISYLSALIPACVIVFFGLLPNLFIKGLGVFMSNFNNFSLEGEGEEVLEHLSIFSLENLKGAAISLTFGAIIYIFFIRRFLTQKAVSGRREAGTIPQSEEKGRVYLQKWPIWLDIEEVIYRPLLINILPSIFGALCRFVAGTVPRFIAGTVLKLSKVIAGFFGGLFDKIVVFTRENAFKDLIMKEHPGLKKAKDNIRRVQDKDEIISSSISANLLFICAGLCLTILFLFYLLFLK